MNNSADIMLGTVTLILGCIMTYILSYTPIEPFSTSDHSIDALITSVLNSFGGIAVLIGIIQTSMAVSSSQATHRVEIYYTKHYRFEKL